MLRELCSVQSLQLSCAPSAQSLGLPREKGSPLLCMYASLQWTCRHTEAAQTAVKWCFIIVCWGWRSYRSGKCHSGSS